MNIQSIELAQLSSVTGGTAKPATQPPATQPSSAPQQTAPRAPTPPPTPTPHQNADLDVVRNIATCARYGGPIAGAICGILTPTPAY